MGLRLKVFLLPRRRWDRSQVQSKRYVHDCCQEGPGWRCRSSARQNSILYPEAIDGYTFHLDVSWQWDFRLDANVFSTADCGPAHEAQAREAETASDQAPSEGERAPRGRGQKNCHEAGASQSGTCRVVRV